MLRDLVARVALGMLMSAIAVSCMGEDKSAPEKVGSIQQALAGGAGGADGLAGADSGGAPIVGGPGAGGAPDAGAGGQPSGSKCNAGNCVGACMHCDSNDK